MIYFWNLIYLTLLILVSPYYLLVKRSFVKGKYRLSDKFGRSLNFPPKKGKRIWIHAVSLGEVNLSIPIVKALKEKGEFEILLTSTTPTGLELARKKLSGSCYVSPSPFDLIISINKFFKEFKPDILILIEAEIWPTLITEAKKRNVPVIITNVRIGKRTEFLFKILKFAVSKILNKIDKFLVQSGKTKNFLSDLGIGKEKITIAGSLKAELILPEFSEEWFHKRKEELNLSKKKIIVVGSTADGEEKILLNAFKKVKRDDVVMVIAPRHPERFPKVENLIKSYGFRYQKKSTFKKDDFEILLLDTIGELPEFYAISDSSFVGGSLVKVGGHNFLEPIFYKKPVFFGPFMHNFRELPEIFITNGGAKMVKNKKELMEMLEETGSESHKKMGLIGHEILNKIKGAKDKTIAEILYFLSK